MVQCMISLNKIDFLKNMRNDVPLVAEVEKVLVAELEN